MRFQISLVTLVLCSLTIVCSERVTLHKDEAHITSVDRSIIIELAENPPAGVTYFLCQAHSQRHDVTLSSQVELKYKTSITGRDVGMLTRDVVKWFLYTNSTEVVQVLLYLHYITSYDPIPGGCNIEFRLENYPNINLHVQDTKTRVQFAWGDTPKDRTSLPSCEVRHSSELEYTLYTKYLPADDFRETTYFKALEQVLSADDMDGHGNQLIKVTNSDSQKSSLKVASYKQRGVIYMLVVRYKTAHGTVSSSAYVPVVSYGCDVTHETECYTRGAAALILSTMAGVMGLFLCYYGHRFFKTGIFVVGFVIFSLLFYQVITLETQLGTPARLSISAVLGLIGGLLLLALWCRLGFPVLSVLFSGLIAGYMFSSALFYTPFGNLSFLRSPFNYGGLFASGVILVPVILSYWTRLLNIVSCALLGSFGFIVMLDMYMKSGLSYMVLNSVRHGTDHDFVNVLVTGPYTAHEIVLTVVWVILFISGVIFQMYNERNKAPFPPCPWHLNEMYSHERGIRRLRSCLFIGEPPDRGGNSRRSTRGGNSRRNPPSREESQRRGGNSTQQTISTSSDREPLLRGSNQMNYGSSAPTEESNLAPNPV